MHFSINSNSSEETFKYGKYLAKLLQPGDIIALSGELGAGKTVFTKGLAAGLGIEDSITSPTFTIIKEYKGRMPLYHFDVYRIESDDLDDLGYDNYFYSKGLSVVEWSEKIADKLPADYLAIKITYGSNEQERKLEFMAKGNFKERLCKIQEILKK